MCRTDVGEEGWKVDWRERADEALAGLCIDAAGYVAWTSTGVRLSVNEAAQRGPAVEMAARARIRLGENVAVEHGEAGKRKIGDTAARTGRPKEGTKAPSGARTDGVATSQRCPVCTITDSQPAHECPSCERRVHVGCSVAATGFCLECGGLEGFDLFRWQN